MTMETARLQLQPFAPADLDAMCRLWNEAGVRRFLWDDEVVPRETAVAVFESSAASFATRGFGFWSLIEKESGEMIGFCGLRPLDETGQIELLYGLTESRWGRGLAVEASRAVLAHGFSCGLERVRAITDAPNEASVRVMEKLGMNLIGRAPHHGLDSVHYEIDRAGFQPSSQL
jgi:RimJ/RimL family protein N-acetyltransferase